MIGASPPAASAEEPVHALYGSNISSAHAHNQRVVLETVRIYGPLSRADISNRTALSSQTVSNIAEKLIRQGTLETRGRRSGQRGQPAIELDINPSGGFAVGLHIDRDHVTGVLLDLAGNAHQMIHRDWNFPGPQEALPLAVQMVRTLTAQHGLELGDLWGVGVGLPGPLDLQSGSPLDPPNFNGWGGMPLRQILSEELGLPVFLDTDATAAAVGERWFGQGRDVHDYFYVYFGMGLGGGMILDGKPYRGGLGNAAMFGHLSVDPHGSLCGCGGTGCLELYASLSSLYAALRAGGQEVRQVGELDALLARQDGALMGWLDQAAGRLTQALTTVENLLSPKAIILGGRLPDSLIDLLISKIERRLPNTQMRSLVHHPRLLRAQATEDAAALGAATLPLFEALTPGHTLHAKAEGLSLTTR